MTEPLFLACLDQAHVDGEVLVNGPEGHHAVSVRRIRVNERVIISDGAGRAAIGQVSQADKAGLMVHVSEMLIERKPLLQTVVVQALAKGDRTELGVETMTELGVNTVVPWQASRSVVKWSDGERGEKQLRRLRSIATQAAKQSRRLWLPEVEKLHTTAAVCDLIRQVDAAFILHESAEEWLACRPLPGQGTVLFIIGPEGGITDQELAAFSAAGASPVLVADHVLRASTAGVVALAQLRALTLKPSAAGP